uniref:MSCRAMM family protein n=1 Tax=Listeria innocua TaxID=1642 RepID=UPI00226D7956
LADATFELRNESDTLVRENLVTDDNGEISVADLAPGDYKLIETKAPTGYQLDATPVNFTIDFNQSEAAKVSKTNTPKTGTVVLTKKDSATNTELADATFELRNEDETLVRENLVTDDNGEISVADLAPGDYKLIETKAPTGYQLDATPVNFTIDFNQSEVEKVSKTNTAKTGTVVLTKKDSATNAELADATFELRNESDTLVRENLVTDDNGEISVADLAPGDYKLIETKAPT